MVGVLVEAVASLCVCWLGTDVVGTEEVVSMPVVVFEPHPARTSSSAEMVTGALALSQRVIVPIGSCGVLRLAASHRRAQTTLGGSAAFRGRAGHAWSTAQP